ncbi:hypothetical protein ACQKE4_13485 [Halomonas sp. NPDC076908]|uniref:hypothetical protein n=1 Tax=Halomonas sp. NPDC076908 TaxID=3390567 RepID=UPI003D03D8E3
MDDFSPNDLKTILHSKRVRCRPGSSEMDSIVGSAQGVVRCRPGSSEIRPPSRDALPKVRCCSGSSCLDLRLCPWHRCADVTRNVHDL